MEALHHHADLQAHRQSGRVDMSDEMLDRLLSCMGYRLEVVRRPVRPTLTRFVKRSWRLHRQLSTHLSPETLKEWKPTIGSNMKRLQGSVQGQPHIRNLDRWRKLVRDGDVSGLRRVMTGLDIVSIEVRGVSYGWTSPPARVLGSPQEGWLMRP